MSYQKPRSNVTGIEVLEQVAALFGSEPMFLKGFGAGVESETWDGRRPNPRGKDSPITLLAEMPAWEGSHRLRGREQDLRYSIGALVGAFATRAGIDTEKLYDRLAGSETSVPQGLVYTQQASLDTRQRVAETREAESLGLAGPLTEMKNKVSQTGQQ